MGVNKSILAWAVVCSAFATGLFFFGRYLLERRHIEDAAISYEIKYRPHTFWISPEGNSCYIRWAPVVLNPNQVCPEQYKQELDGPQTMLRKIEALRRHVREEWGSHILWSTTRTRYEVDRQGLTRRAYYIYAEIEKDKPKHRQPTASVDR